MEKMFSDKVQEKTQQRYLTKEIFYFLNTQKEDVVHCTAIDSGIALNRY